MRRASLQEFAAGSNEKRAMGQETTGEEAMKDETTGEEAMKEAVPGEAETK